jgi:RNA polymerase sigma-70 factor (ECF subfamily)
MPERKKADSTTSDQTGRLQDDRPSDGDLVSKAVAGSDEAFAELVRRHRDRAVNIAYHLLGDRSDAEDVAQEAFVRVYRSLREFRRESDFSWWLFRVITNASLEMARRRHKRGLHYIDEMQGPDAQVSDEEKVDAALTVGRAMERIPAEQRAVLALRELDGFDYQEIAEILSIPVGTVRSRLYYARKGFRKALKEGEKR